MATIHGRNLVLKINGNAIAAAKDCSLDYNVETNEVASPTSGTAKNYIIKRSSWSVSVSGLVLNTTINSLLTLIKTTQRSAILQVSMSDGTNTITGNAYMTSIKFSGTVGSIATYSATLQGSGDIS